MIHTPLRLILQRFGDVEHELQEMTQAEESNIDRCLELVKMNEEAMDMMRVRSVSSLLSSMQESVYSLVSSSH
jgi:hypothetical protein